MSDPVALAFLMLDGKARQTCIGCSQLLYDKGMLVIADEIPISERQPEFVSRAYAIAPGFTLEDCRAVIKERHIGPEWGS